MKMDCYRRWSCGLLAGVVTLLTLCGAVVYRVDPCFYFRMPTDRQPVFFSERYQTAGILRNNPADVVLMGSSMAANYSGSEVGECFGGTGLRVTLPDGYMEEFDQAMDLLMRTHPPRRVLFAADMNILTRAPGGDTGALPTYLYDENPVNDVKYLLNKDTLYYSLYALMCKKWGQGEPLDKGFVWDESAWWNHMEALEEYDRPEIVPEERPADLLLTSTAENLRVIAGWAERYPEVQFDIFLSPYSILYWDKTDRLGETDAVFAALELVCETLLPHENITLHGLLFDREIVEQLDNYCDYIHHSAAAGSQALKKIAAGDDAITAADYREKLADWREFVTDYDYEKFWDEHYWYQFHTD